MYEAGYPTVDVASLLVQSIQQTASTTAASEASANSVDDSAASLTVTTTGAALSESTTAVGSAAESATAGSDGDWEFYHTVIAEKLGRIVGDAPADGAAGIAGVAAGGSGTRVAKFKRVAKGKKGKASGHATEGGRVEKILNEKTARLVREWIREYPEEGIFRKVSGKWQIRRGEWGAFLDYLETRGELGVGTDGSINLVEKKYPMVTIMAAPPVLPSSAVPSEAGPSST